MIARTWGGKVPLGQANGFHRHLLETGVADYRRQPGCLQTWMWRRDADGWAHFQLVSLWCDLAAVHGYAGTAADLAVLYPGDERFGLVPDATATHYEVLDLDRTAQREPAERCALDGRPVDRRRRAARRGPVRGPHRAGLGGLPGVERRAGAERPGRDVAGRADGLGDVYVKTGVLRGHEVYIVKVSPWFAVNLERGQPQGGIVGVFDSRTGHTLAILNEEHYLSDIRTAAAGALAARMLAPARVETAVVLGAGVQAYWQPRALYRERPFGRLLVWARTTAKAAALGTKLAAVLPEVEVRVCADLESAVRAADVLITATAAREPLVRGEWLHAGQHLTAVGADDAGKCELDVSALKRARVFVDSLRTTAAHGDVHRALRGGDYMIEEVAGEIGEVLAGRRTGRESADDITIAKFVGIGAQDVVAAECALERL